MDPLTCTSSENHVQEKGQTVHLLEDCWFFGNLLNNTNKKMIRCNSDPSSSSSVRAGNLPPTPPMPPCISGGGEKEEEEEEEARMGDLIRQAVPCKKLLQRTPSLPPQRWAGGGGGLTRRASLGSSTVAGAVAVVEKGDGVGRLTRRASIDSSSMLPPRCTTKGSSNSKNRTLRKLESPNSNSNSNHDDRTLDRSKSLKSLSDVELEELKGFKDVGFTFDKQDLSPSVVRVVPGLQATARATIEENSRRPYLSEAWHKPPIPNWVDTGSPRDMKAQIKFWARAVASNVR